MIAHASEKKVITKFDKRYKELALNDTLRYVLLTGNWGALLCVSFSLVPATKTFSYSRLSTLSTRRSGTAR